MAGGQQVVAADHLIHAGVGVVDHHGQVIGRDPVVAPDHDVVDHSAHLAVQHVVPPAQRRRRVAGAPAYASAAGRPAAPGSAPGRCPGSDRPSHAAHSPPRRSPAGCRSTRRSDRASTSSAAAYAAARGGTGPPARRRSPAPSASRSARCCSAIPAGPGRCPGPRSAAGTGGRSSGRTARPAARSAGSPGAARRSDWARSDRLRSRPPVDHGGDAVQDQSRPTSASAR